MQLLYIFATIVAVASAQEFIPASYGLVDEDLNSGMQFEELQPLPSEQEIEYIPHPRFRRGFRMDPQTGDVTADHSTGNGRVFGTLGSNDNGLFGKAGYEHRVFDDHRGRLDAQAFGQRSLGAAGASSGLGGALRWHDDRAAASLDVSKQLHGGTSWTAAGGGRWPVGRNGDFGLEGTYSHLPGGVRDYGGRGVFNYRF